MLAEFEKKFYQGVVYGIKANLVRLTNPIRKSEWDFLKTFRNRPTDFMRFSWKKILVIILQLLNSNNSSTDGWGQERSLSFSYEIQQERKDVL